YEVIVPKKLRHDLGEYYTPDWLAELVIDEAGYEGNPRSRILDPACGSGTFLVLAIHKARRFAEKKGTPRVETAKNILANVWGFDLNPLAVIAARTNYLFAFGELINYQPTVEIPVYLADSVLWPKEAGGTLFGSGEGAVRVNTSVGPFHAPAIWVTQGGFLMKEAAPLIEEMVKANYAPAEALKRLQNKGLVFSPHENAVSAFYSEILKLEQEGKNGIWARLLKNSFAPLVAGNFDFVVGNPPWVRWGYLSKEYRDATLPLWEKYGLFSLKGHAARLGGGEKDFAMLFTCAAIDYYLPPKGILAFLITQEVFKSKGAGEGFRRFSLGAEGEFRVRKAHDLVTVQPFEGATNKTAMIVIEKGKPTRYPVPYTVWTRCKGVGKIPTDTVHADALDMLKKQRLSARPIGKATGAWQTLSSSQTGLAKIKGHNAYQARLGARVEPYGVFWLTVEQVMSDGNLLVRNMHDRGKREIQSVEERIEKGLVFPAVSGAHIERWRATPGIYILMSQDPHTCEPYPEARMKQEWPRTYAYLTRFKDVLLSRGSKTVRQLAERTAFYAMFGIGPYTVARYRVVWKRMASDLVAAVVSQHKTPFGYKKVIATDTTSLFATESEDEAHYLCAIINSKSVREFLKSFSSAGRGFGAPSVMEPVGIPEFDGNKPLHRKLASLSKSLHQKKNEGQDMDCHALEREVDEAVVRFFGMKE
ncbi:MAG: N-6 DNA methylase, partial [Planctomycetes bacterium]|nr:N-6 DNA methylase [Planctomycetota bacterium]